MNKRILVMCTLICALLGYNISAGDIIGGALNLARGAVDTAANVATVTAADDANPMVDENSDVIVISHPCVACGRLRRATGLPGHLWLACVPVTPAP